MGEAPHDRGADTKNITSTPEEVKSSSLGSERFGVGGGESIMNSQFTDDVDNDGKRYSLRKTSGSPVKISIVGERNDAEARKDIRRLSRAIRKNEKAGGKTPRKSVFVPVSVPKAAQVFARRSGNIFGRRVVFFKSRGEQLQTAT